MKIYKTNDTFYMEDNNTIIELSPNKDYFLKLPENSVNRVWVSCRKVDNAPNQTIDYGDIVKTPRTLTTSKRPLEDYLNDEDKAMYLALIEKAKKAREEATKKPMTEEEKLKAKIAKYKAQYEALLAKSK